MIEEIEHLIICLQEITKRPPLLFLFYVDDFWREISSQTRTGDGGGQFSKRLKFGGERSGAECILGDPGADSGDEGKSKLVEKCGAKKSKERREEPLGTMSYQTSSKRSPLFWLLIGARKTPIRSQNGGDRLELVW